MRIAGMQIPRTKAFSAITELAYSVGGQTPTHGPTQPPATRRDWGSDPGDAHHRGQTPTPPYMTEGWYCCAEPGPEQTDLV
jgi:hypothetical protein